MRIIYLGSGEFGVECLSALHSGGLAGSSHTLQFIVTGPSHPAGRGRKPRPTPVARWASAQGGLIPFIETKDVNSPEVRRAIIDKIAARHTSGGGAELIVVIAFGQKIGNELIKLPPKGAINVHASLLPKYRGAAPINWAIINGESQTGISIITLAEKMDAGKILAQAKTNIGENETAGQLHDRLARLAAPLLLKTLNQIADGTAIYTEQDHSKATSAPKLKKSDGFLDFNDSAKSIRRKILGFWPWPGASAIYVSKKTSKSQRVTIAEACVVETSNPTGLRHGEFDENLSVICAEDALNIIKIKPAGRSLMDFTAFVNGWQTHSGDLFTKIDN